MRRFLIFIVLMLFPALASGQTSKIPQQCHDTSGSATAQVCTTTLAFTGAGGLPVLGDAILYSTTTTNTGDLTIAINGAAAQHVKEWLGAATLSSGDMPAGVGVLLIYDGTAWETMTIGNPPSGGIGGTVTSVGMSSLSWITISGSPVTTSGTFTAAPATGQTSHQVIGTCGSATTFTPCSLVQGDLPATSAPLASPTFTGAPAAPTATAGTNTTQLATTAFVLANSTQTIAHGTVALGTSSISSGSCDTTGVGVTATGVAATDTMTYAANTDISGVTGYGSTSGFLTIYPYPGSSVVNFKVCNWTGSSITPGAVTLNWRVVR